MYWQNMTPPPCCRGSLNYCSVTNEKQTDVLGVTLRTTVQRYLANEPNERRLLSNNASLANTRTATYGLRYSNDELIHVHVLVFGIAPDIDINRQCEVIVLSCNFSLCKFMCLILYNVCVPKCPPFYFSSNSVKN